MVMRTTSETKKTKTTSTEMGDLSDGQSLIEAMVAAGATKVAIAKAVGVSDMTILSVAQVKTKTFRKLKKLQSVYDRWKAGKLDLSGKRGKKLVEAPVAEDAPVGKKAPEKKSLVPRKPVQAVKARRIGRERKDAHVSVSAGFSLPSVTEAMVAEVEEQIWLLQAEAKYMRDLIALRKTYGM